MVLGFRMVFIARKLSLATKWKPLRSTSKETSKVAVVASFVNGLAAMKMITSPEATRVCQLTRLQCQKRRGSCALVSGWSWLQTRRKDDHEGP